MPFLVEDLIEGQGKPVIAPRDCSAKHALELMMEHDFNQLPVVDEDHKPLGMVTNESILRSLNCFDVKLDALQVSDALVKGRVFRVGEELFELLDDLRERYAVLIVDGEGTLVGIVTSYDTTEYFRRHSEDMMVVQDIESCLKYYIRMALGAEEGEENDALREAIVEITPSKSALRKKYKEAIQHLWNSQGVEGKPDPEQINETFSKHLGDDTPVKGFDDLTLGEYINMFLHEKRWPSYEPVFSLKPGAIRNLLEEVRVARNKLAHFNGDLDTRLRVYLRFCANWLNYHQAAVEELFSAKDEKSTAATDAVAPYPQDSTEGDTAPLEEQPDARKSRYAPLAAWLQAVAADEDRVQLTFEQIERIIGDDLPPYARRHRSWWANDPAGHPHSQEWLNVGWRATADMAQGKVVFSRITEGKLAYIRFFADLLAELSRNTDLPVREARPDGRSWHFVARLPADNPHSSFLVYAFTRDKRFRVELYIDTGDEERNKLIFDTLYHARDDIVDLLGEVSWERLDGRRASRVALYRDASISDDDSKLEALKEWAVPTMIRFREVISEHLPRNV